MMNFTGEQLQKDWHHAFGSDIEDVTPQQMLWLIKFAKHIRGRCRSNAALRNYLSLNFKGLFFREEVREGRNGKSYKALLINSKRVPASVAAEEADTEE